ncbi:MAG: hypothetical protein JXB62_09985 [Pirellulales bacterium]|nr:hypothetical protein [Pirellulales bacterium]
MSAVTAAQDQPEAKAADVPAADTPARLGRTIRILQPITAEEAGRVKQFVRRVIEKARKENARPVLIFEFGVPEDRDDFSGTEFSVALGLARFLAGSELNAAQTVAYVPESIRGHAVLVALACDQIMMPGEAELGPVSAGPEPIGPTERSAYTEIAERRRTIPVNVALWLLDPSLDVLKVETEISTEYVLPQELDALREVRTIKSEQPLRELSAAGAGRFTGDEARRLDFVGYLPDSRAEVAKVLELPPDAMEEDPSLVRHWQPVRVDLRGPINASMVRQLENAIKDKVQAGEVNFVCVWIDSLGGSPEDSIHGLAEFLVGLDPSRVRTVAYIPLQARSDAALVALACDQVVMHPRAKLGGSEASRLSAEEIEYAQQSIRNPDGPWRGRSWSLPVAMINPQLEVYRCARPGEVGYFCDEELKELRQADPNGPAWEKGMPITRPNETLLVDGTRAVEYGLANRTAEDLEEFQRYYGLDELVVLESSWADFLIDALASPGVSALVLMIAFVALYAELHAPGIGVGGFVATVCFLLFFWSHYLGGTAGWLEITLFVAGVACLLLEIFVLPGFGIFGLGGGCLVLISLILASQTFVLPHNQQQYDQLQWSLLTVAGAGVGIVATAFLLRRWLPRAPLFNRMMLQPPEGEEAESISRRESLVELGDFVGSRGTTTTQLTPSGKARFGTMLVDVITDGDVVARGTEIEVVEVHGNRIVVRAVEGS